MSARNLRVLLKGVVISLLAPLVFVAAAQAAITCNECHGGASDYRPLDSGTFGTAGRNDATGAFTGNHQTHMGPLTTQSAAVIACATCHNPTVSTTGHRDGNIGMSTNINSSQVAATYSKGPSFAQTAVVTPGTCSNVSCHFETQTPLWGTTTLSSTGPTTTTCNVCHSSQLTGTPTKAHTTHLNAIGTTLGNCVSCHPNYNALGANAFWHATSAGQRRINVNFSAAPNSGIGTYSGAGASTAYPAYLPSQSPQRSGTCTATYCHSDGHIENGSAPGSQTNTPGAPAMVASWGSTWANSHCANCHGDGVSNAWPTYTNSGAATTNANSHPKHMLASGMGCVNCHVATTTTGTTVIPGGQHLDHSVQVGFNTTAGGALGSYAFNTKTCSATTCHGNTSPAWGGATNCASCHESMGAWGTSTDTYNPAHQKHVLAAGYDFSCQNCHSSATTAHATGPVTTFQSAEVKYNTTGTAVTTGLYGNSPVNYRTLPSMTTNPYNGAASATPWYTGSTAVWTTDSVNPSVKYSAGSCGNVYCHSNAAPVGGANSYVTATWTTSTPLTCASCHSASGGSVNHAKHVTTYGFTCKNCHDTAVSSNTTISNALVHVNAVKDVAFNWNGMTTGTYTSGSTTCASIYCHSPGTANAAPFTAPLRVASWTTTLGCDGCHGGMGAGLTTIASGSHTRHVTDQTPVFGAAFTCDKCHANTVSSNTTISNAANHANQLVNVNFLTTLNVNGLATYTGSATPGAVDGSCNSVYCHSDGHIQNGTALGSQNGTPGIAAAMVTWGQAWANNRCVNCHGDGSVNAWPTYANSGPATTNSNSHSKHMLASGIGCVNCHVATAASNTTVVSGGGQHLDKSVQVGFNSTAGGALGSYAFNTKTCSATTCHGNTSPAWGGATNCASCHESMGAWGTSTDTYNPAHQKHVLATGYDFSCQNCHSSATTAHATGPVTTFQSAEVKYNTTGTAVTTGLYGNSPVNYRTLPSMTTNPYNGAASATPWYTGSTAAWTTDSINPSVKYSAGSCGNVYCHSNAAPVGGANSYVTATWSTTPMTCTSCHNIPSTGSARHTIHVTTYGFTCKNCHDTAVTSNTTISNAAVHVNAVKDVAFNWNSMTTGTYTSGSTSCSNIYCHSDGTKSVAPFASVQNPSWTTTLGCANCHGNFGAGMSTINSNAHLKHVAAGYTCNYCHNATAASNSALSTITYHVNNNVTVQFNATAALTTATYMGTTASGTAVVQKAPGSTTGTCNATACHGSNSGNWGTVTTQATCVTCHGVAGSTQALYTSNNDLAAPGYLVTGVNTAGVIGTISSGVSNNSKVGAHDTHLRALGGFGTTNGVECNQCHAVTALGDAGHMNGSTTFTWGTLATNRAGSSYAAAGTLAPTYNAPNCSNVYCHGAAFTTTVRGAGFATISWVDGTYLTALGTSANVNDCNKCHATPPTASPRTTAHNAMTTSTFATDNCAGCHGHKGSGATHINGTLEATGGACDGCHSYDVVAGNWGTNPYTNWGSNNLSAGAHAKHIPYLKARYGVTLISTIDQFNASTISNSVQKVCGACHMITGGGHMNTTVRQITFGASTQYQFGGSIPTYNGSSLTTINKSCSNLDCHYKTSPVWAP